MYFKRADRKIREACYHLNSLTKSENVDEFETIFASFLSSSRSVTLALTSEAGVKFDKNGNVKEKGGLEGFAIMSPSTGQVY